MTNYLRLIPLFLIPVAAMAVGAVLLGMAAIRYLRTGSTGAQSLAEFSGLPFHYENPNLIGGSAIINAIIEPIGRFNAGFALLIGGYLCSVLIAVSLAQSGSLPKKPSGRKSGGFERP